MKIDSRMNSEAYVKSMIDYHTHEVSRWKKILFSFLNNTGDRKEIRIKSAYKKTGKTLHKRQNNCSMCKKPYRAYLRRKDGLCSTCKVIKNREHFKNYRERQKAKMKAKEKAEKRGTVLIAGEQK